MTPKQKLMAAIKSEVRAAKTEGIEEGRVLGLEEAAKNAKAEIASKQLALLNEGRELGRADMQPAIESAHADGRKLGFSEGRARADLAHAEAIRKDAFTEGRCEGFRLGMAAGYREARCAAD